MKLNKKGTVFITVIILSMLMGTIGCYIGSILYQDTYMMRHLKDSAAAKYLAEAGANDALATLMDKGFSAKDNPANFPERNLGEGTYDVTVVESGSRVLLRSVGTVRNASQTASLEVKDLTPTSLYYMMSSGNDLRVKSLIAIVDIDGNMHANHNVHLRKGLLSTFDVDNDGNVSASNTVYLQPPGDPPTVHGTVTNGAPMVTFPVFNYTYYKTLAESSNDYYSGDQTFGAFLQTTDISPGNGIVYVEGKAKFKGTCNLHGGVVADEILILGTLNQYKTGHNRNVVISRTKDIKAYVRLKTEEALIYAGRDFRTASLGKVEVRGTIIASRNIRIWDCITVVDYDHVTLYPDGLIIGPTGIAIEVVSWTR